MTLRRQVAVVTGGAHGLGAATAERLRAEGATVEVLDLDNGVDVSNEKHVGAAMADVLKRHGRIDVLINNAGIYPHIPFEQMTLVEWRRVMSVNLDGVFLCCRAAYPEMRERGYGRIVNIASGAFFIGYPGLSAYIASKGGVIGFTRTLASEAGRHGITVNAIAPGLISTEHAIVEEGSIFDEIVPQQAIARAGRPEDIAECIVYLSRPEASWITGQTINVDGGYRYH
ncbi:MAG: SDR family oxidoreductase [Actinomycetota bacterium]|nr:SDR family oxidoreductase [Actinomycetota bacterium]